MGLCPHHCPKPASGAGSAVLVIAGVVVLASVAGPVAAGTADAIGELVHIVLMVLLAITIAAATAAAGYVAYRAIRWRQHCQAAALPAGHRLQERLPQRPDRAIGKPKPRLLVIGEDVYLRVAADDPAAAAVRARGATR